jgi:hypothetical protein
MALKVLEFNSYSPVRTLWDFVRVTIIASTISEQKLKVPQNALGRTRP